MGNNENWALQMKRDFADLICLLCHCDSYHQKISLPWVETSTARARKGAVNGVSQGALPSYFHFSCVIFSSSYLERPAGIHQFSKGRCFLRMHFSCWEMTLSLFTNLSTGTHGELEFKLKHIAERSWSPSQSAAPCLTWSITGHLDLASHILARIYPTWLSRGTLPLP